MRIYIEITIPVQDKDVREILIAELSEIDFEGFEEEQAHLKAFIDQLEFNRPLLEEIISRYQLGYTSNEVADRNWNQEWESGFEPVIIKDFCAIRADFHPPVKNVAHEIIVTPKMSFGTGHHATTWLMISAMKDISFEGKSVLDFGTGTGVLAILANQLGAKNILAIDNDDWSIENARENFARNNCRQIDLTKDNSIYSTGNYNIILANINKNVIIDNLPLMRQHLSGSGVLLLSGLLIGDRQDILQETARNGFESIELLEKDGWMCIKLHVKD